MKNLLFVLLCPIALFLLLSNCSEESDTIISEETDAEILYNNLSKIQTVSLISNNNISRGSSDLSKYALPTFTTEDLNFISSLTQDEFIAFRDSIINQLGGDADGKIEEVEIYNYKRICNSLKGDEGVNQLAEFASSYLESSAGWTSIKSLLPIDLTIIETKIYISMAVYVDKVARPLYLKMTEKSNDSRSLSYCDWEAALRLALAGVNIGVDGLVDVMTGGAGLVLTPEEGAIATVELTAIWLDYEVCNGRWH